MRLSSAATGQLGKKLRLCIVGGGWAGFRLATDLDKTKYAVDVISPTNHFLFTPLLPSTAVGTLEFRAIQEPIRTIPNLEYQQAAVESIDFDAQTLQCRDAFTEGHTFTLPYDILILAPGSETATFGINGVAHKPSSHVYFLKQLKHSRAIRDRLIECFEQASSLGTSAEQRKQLLTFVIVGGGPTNVEFASELHDFLSKDIKRLYPDLYSMAKYIWLRQASKSWALFTRSLSRMYSTSWPREESTLLPHKALLVLTLPPTRRRWLRAARFLLACSFGLLVSSR